MRHPKHIIAWLLMAASFAWCIYEWQFVDDGQSGRHRFGEWQWELERDEWRAVRRHLPDDCGFDRYRRERFRAFRRIERHHRYQREPSAPRMANPSSHTINSAIATYHRMCTAKPRPPNSRARMRTNRTTPTRVASLWRTPALRLPESPVSRQCVPLGTLRSPPSN